MSRQTRLGIALLALLFVPLCVALLFTFQIIRIPLPTDMVHSPAIDYQEGPRRLPPDGAVPIQGQSIIPEEFPSNPIASDANSLQRGELLYGIHCALCHGERGAGDGPLAQYFERTPENLGSEQAAAEFDGAVYLTIVQGFGEMPSLAENLTVRERWDVINYIRTLPSEGD